MTDSIAGVSRSPRAVARAAEQRFRGPRTTRYVDGATNPTRRGFVAPKGVLLNLAFAGATLAAVSRGLFEAAGGKTTGYAAQLGAFVMLTALLLATGRPEIRAPFARNLAWLYAFVLIALISAAVTSVKLGTTYFWLYLGVMVFYAMALFVYSSVEFRVAVSIRFGPILATTSVLLVAVASLQQFRGFSALPGSDFASMGGAVRPASLTGSYLHYPLALSLLAFLLIGLFTRERRAYLLIAAVLNVFAVVAGFSRSGMMILALGAAIYVVLLSENRIRLRLIYFGCIAACGAFFLTRDSVYFDRAASALNLEGAGNSVRVDRWGEALSMWMQSPIFVGEYTGEVTNVTGNFSDAQTTVVESGLLQQLVSFGALGAIAFYLLLCAPIQAVPSRDRWMRAGLIAALLESLVYQSIEVFPFMYIFAIAPLVFQDGGTGLTARHAAPPADASDTRESVKQPQGHFAPVRLARVRESDRRMRNTR